MRTYPECFACMIRTAQDTLQLSGVAMDDQVTIIRQVLKYLEDAPVSLSPSHLSSIIQRMIREASGVEDAFLEIKQEGTRAALAIYPSLKEMVAQGQDQLEQVIKISASGNVIDAVHMQDYDLLEEVVRTVNQPLLGNGLEEFRHRLAEAESFLYIADNAGETVFDRVMIEALDRPVIYAVKEGAVFNDATRTEAVEAGIDQIAEIVETGSRGPGTILEESTPEFLDLFQNADLVLAKGQANYETLDDKGLKVFHLLRIKCPVLAEVIGYPVGNLVLEQAREA